VTLVHGLSRRAVVACVFCALVGVVGTALVFYLGGRYAIERITADGLRGMMDSGVGELCRESPDRFVWRTPSGGWAGFYDRATGLSANPEAPPAAQDLLARLGPDRPAASRLIPGGAGGGAYVASLGESGPCSLYYARWPSIPNARPVVIVGLLLFMVVAAAFSGFFALRYVTRPAFRRLESVATAAKQVGDHAPAADVERDELSVVADSLSWAHQRIAADRERLDERARALEGHLADLAHDVKTPLTSLFLSLEDISNDPEAGPDARQQAQLALGDAVYLAAIVENQRLDSQLQHAAAPVGESDAESFDLGEVVTRVVRRYRLVARGRQIRIDDAIATGPAIATGSAVLAEQAIANLVQNAVTYGDRRVLVALATAADGFELRVENDGPHMDDETLSRLGTRHYRADLARTRAPWGSGLGLSITRAVASRLGWSLAFERGSEVEGGLVAIVRGTCSAVEPR
jgi:signal transduction histidine kinase